MVVYVCGYIVNRCVGVPVHVCVSAWVYGYVGVGESMGVWVPRCVGVWVFGCVGVGL